MEIEQRLEPEKTHALQVKPMLGSRLGGELWRQSSATSRETGLVARCTTLPPAGPATRLHPYTYTKRTVVGSATRECSLQEVVR